MAGSINAGQIVTIAVPLVTEVFRFINSRMTQTGSMPTEAEVISHLRANVDNLVGEIDEWLAAHPPGPSEDDGA